MLRTCDTHANTHTITLVKFSATDATRPVPVVLLEQGSPLLHEHPQGREAKKIDTTQPALVKHVYGKTQHNNHFTQMQGYILRFKPPKK